MAFSPAKGEDPVKGICLNFGLTLGRRNGEDEQLNILRWKDEEKEETEVARKTGGGDSWRGAAVAIGPEFSRSIFDLHHLHIEISVLISPSSNRRRARVCIQPSARGCTRYKETTTGGERGSRTIIYFLFGDPITAGYLFNEIGPLSGERERERANKPAVISDTN